MRKLLSLLVFAVMASAMADIVINDIPLKDFVIVAPAEGAVAKTAKSFADRLKQKTEIALPIVAADAPRMKSSSASRRETPPPRSSLMMTSPSIGKMAASISRAAAVFPLVPPSIGFSMKKCRNWRISH